MFMVNWFYPPRVDGVDATFLVGILPKIRCNIVFIVAGTSFM